MRDPTTTAPTPEEGRPEYRDGWDRIIRQHDQRVLLSVLAMGVRLDTARDVVQSAWTKLIEKHGEREMERLEFPGLAIAQARFLALDMLRRERNRTAVEAKSWSAAHETLSGHLDPEHRYLSSEQLSIVLAVVSSSPELVQRVFMHVYAEGAQSHGDVARELGLTIQRVRQILCELRRAIRAATARESK